MSDAEEAAQKVTRAEAELMKQAAEAHPTAKAFRVERAFDSVAYRVTVRIVPLAELPSAEEVKREGARQHAIGDTMVRWVARGDVGASYKKQKPPAGEG